MRVHSNTYSISDDQWVFIHVPKTGGTSLHHSIKDPRVVGKNIHLFINPSYPPSKYNYFTFLRHPVDRAWSYYQMSLRQNNRGYLRFGRDLKNLLSCCWETHNAMTMIFSGKECGDYYSLIYRNGGAVSDSDFKELYKSALSNLKDFKFIGFTENIEQDSLLLKKYIDIDNIEHRNKHTYAKISDSDKEQIEEKNYFDLMLYNTIKNQ